MSAGFQGSTLIACEGKPAPVVGKIDQFLVRQFPSLGHTSIVREIGTNSFKMCLAMLVQHDGEALGALFNCVDRAIGLAWSDGLFTDEANVLQEDNWLGKKSRRWHTQSFTLSH